LTWQQSHNQLFFSQGIAVNHSVLNEFSFNGLDFFKSMVAFFSVFRISSRFFKT
jgi:hypothetical protein